MLRRHRQHRAQPQAVELRRGGLLARTLDQAIGKYLENARYPSRKVNEIDNRGSTFYLAEYWAQALAAQDKDAALKARFSETARQLEANEEKINSELVGAQGRPVDMGGYYHPDRERTRAAMRPSAALNGIIDALLKKAETAAV